MSQSTDIVERDPRTVLSKQLEKGAAELRKALPSHISPDKFQRTVITAAASNPALLNADRQSLLLACMKAAQDGLLPDGREAALVIFNTRQKDAQGQWNTVSQVQYMPMVYGLRKKILQSGEVKDITAKVVYARELADETFIYEEGTERMLRHRPNLLLTDEETADDQIVAAYSIATFEDGSMSYEVMSRAEINRVRAVSKTGAEGMTDRSGKPIPPKGPWVDWFPEMAKKTVMRRHAKTLPMSGDLLDSIERGDEGLVAASVGRALSVEPDAPVALPSATDLTSGERDDETPPHDPETGEIADEHQGDPTVDGNTGEEPTFTDRMVQRMDAAATIIDLNAARDDWTRHMGALPDYDNDRIDAAHLEARERLTPEGSN